jgi:O-antigen ligase
VRRVSSPTNPMVRTVFPILVFFLAAIYTGILEKMQFLAPFHLLMLLGGLALIVIGLSGRLPAVVNNPIAKWVALFTVWFIICIPFGYWIGGSVQQFLDVWSKAALAFVLVAGCVQTIDQCKTIFKTIGYSVGILAMMALALRGVDKTGRLGLLDTRYDNANDFAWTLVLGLSFLLFLLFNGNLWQKIVAGLFCAPILLALTKTGSRGGMLGFCLLAVFGLFQASRATRIKLAIAVPVVLVLLFIVTPPDIRARYTTIFGSGKDYTGIAISALSSQELLQSSASASAEARWGLLKDSIRLTLEHPVFGVGPGNFQVAQAEIALARGESRGAWRVTHNTYTQLSSEMGIPGLVIYVMFLYQCLKALNRIAHSRYTGRDWRDLRALAKALRATFLSLIPVMFFGSFGYDTNMPILGGLACALSLIAQRRRALLKVSAQVAPTLQVPQQPVIEPAWVSLQLPVE